MKNNIPETLFECFDYFKKSPSLVNCFLNHNPKDKPWIQNGSQKVKMLDEIPYGIHFGLGMGIRNKWGLWKKQGELYNYFKSLGVWHADDMSSIIFVSFYRHLHGLPLDISKQVSYYKKFWGENIPEDAFTKPTQN